MSTEIRAWTLPIDRQTLLDPKAFTDAVDEWYATIDPKPTGIVWMRCGHTADGLVLELTEQPMDDWNRNTMVYAASEMTQIALLETAFVNPRAFIDVNP